MTACLKFAAIVALCLCITTCVATAQEASQVQTDIPRTLTYQGRISFVKGASTPVGMYSICAHLFSDSSGTTEIWKDTYSVFVSDGVFNLVLGSGTTPLPIDKMDAPLWVGVQIDRSPMMKPLTALAATPYALAIPNGSVTAKKMGTNYVASVRLNGQKISGRGEDLNIVTGPGLSASVDPVTGSVLIASTSTVAGTTRGASAEANSTITGSLTTVQNTLLNTGYDNSGHPTTTTIGSNAASNPGVINFQQGQSSGGHQVILQTTSGTMSGDAVVTLPTSTGTLVLNARSISAGTGLSGGGDLSANRTLALNVSNANNWTGVQSLPINASQGNNLISAINSGNSGAIGVATGGTGVTSSGAAGNYLRSNGASWASSGIQVSDIPAGSSSYIQNTSSMQSNSNFSISGSGTVGGNLVLASSGGQLQLQGSGAGASTLRAGAQGASSINYTLPIAAPSANQMLAATSVSGTGPFAVTLGWASAASGGGPLFASKSADQNYSSTSLTSDSHLVIALASNATYTFDGFLSFEDVNQDVSAGAKIAFTVPAGATLKWGVNTSGGVFVTKNVMNTSGTALSGIAIENAASGDENFVYVKGMVITGATAGNLQLQCAKGNGTTLRLHQNSYLTGTRMQ